MLKTRTSIGFEDLIEILYDGEATISLEDNIIETPELYKWYQRYIDTYIAPILEERGYDVREEADIELGGLTAAYEKRGFEMGFKTAMALITGNGVQA